MKIRLIILILSLLSFLSTGLGGYLYYATLQESYQHQAHAAADLRTRILASHMDSSLSEYQKAARAMASLVRLKTALLRDDMGSLEKANEMLDQFRAALEVEVCYLMDSEGNAIASSNRHDADSFVGKNYRFRPYFQQAVQGIPSTYMALGVTSNRPGFYFSHPVYKENSLVVSGVVVIKASVNAIQNEVEQIVDGVAVLAAPEGVIFAASQPDLLYQTLWEIPISKKTAIIASQQFGNSPLTWTGMTKTDPQHASNRAGTSYMIHTMEVARAPGWQVLYFHNLDVLYQKAYLPLLKASGLIIIVITVFTGLAVYFLYRVASRDIVRRRQAEKALAEAHANLARRVEERTADLKETNEQLNAEIAGRKRSEEALLAAKEHLQAIYDASPDMIFLHSADGQILDVNQNALATFGYSLEEMKDPQPSDIIGKIHTREMTLEKIELTLQGQTPHFEWQAKKKSGEEFPVEVCLSRLELVSTDGNAKKPGVLAILRDITERKKIEEHLRHSQKIEAVGKLAGGIAHDFNNILMAIMGYGELLRIKLPADSSLREFVDQILVSSERAARLTQGLLAFSRKQVIDPKLVALNEIVTTISKMLARIIGEDIELLTTLTPQEPIVMLDSNKMEQALLNLATNARDAMPDGGRFSLETGTAVLDEAFSQAHGYGRPGQFALLTATDTGIGMDESTRERIFEPFYTTKDVGKGTGLGLAIVYGIVKQHSGYIDVSSEPGRGTTFRIYLPLQPTADKPVAEQKQEESEAAVGGTETVLLAEDDLPLRTLLSATLKSHGYNVVEAMDGADALQKFLQHRDTVQILILDVVMPKMTGLDVWEEARKTKPVIKVVFMSGYSEDILQKKGKSEFAANLVMKPVSQSALLKKIREILDS